MKEKSFKTYIHRTLHSLYPDTHITRSALEAVDSIIRTIATKLVDRTITLTLQSDKKTISINEISAAVNLLVYDSLARSCISQGETASKLYSESVEAESKLETTEKATLPGYGKSKTRESRANLIFSVSAAEKYLRCFDQNSLRITANSIVFFTAILQEISEEILSAGQIVAHNNDRKTISLRHLFLAVTEDANLKCFTDNLGIVFLQAGIEPHIEEKLLEKKPRTKPKRKSEVKSGVETETKSHRWRPGTKTLMNIRKLQKGTEMLIQHAPFIRLVREVGTGFQSNMRYTKDFFMSIQALIENDIISLMRSSILLALHSGRETVYGKDLTLLCSFRNETILDSSSSENPVPEAALRKLAQRAGIKRYGEDCTKICRDFIYTRLNTYLKDMFICAQVHDVQTLSVKIFLESLSMKGINPSIVHHKRGVGKKKAVSTDLSATPSRTVSMPDVDTDISDVEENLEDNLEENLEDSLEAATQNENF